MISLPERVAALKQTEGTGALDSAPLIAALSDPARGVREEIVTLLVSAGTATVSSLEDAVQSDDRITAEGALMAAIRMGRKGQTVIIKALTCEDGALRLAALSAPPMHILPEGAAVLVECFQHPDSAVRHAAAVILSASQGLENREPVVTTLWTYLEKHCLSGNENAATGSAATDAGWYLAAEILGVLLAEDAVRQRFKPLLESNKSELVAVGARALGGCGRPEATKTLIKLLRHPSPVVCAAAMDALEHIGRSALPLLKTVFSKSTSDFRARTLAVMFRIMKSGSGPLLNRLLATGPDLKLAALSALKGVQGSWNIPHLLSCLTDSSSLVVREAVARLIETGPVGVPLLLNAIEDETVPAPEAIGQVLCALGGSGRIALAKLLPKVSDPIKKHLISLLAEPVEETFVSVLATLLMDCGDVVREEIAKKLGKSGPGVIEPLTGILLSEHVGAWYWAARALIDTGDSWKSWITAELKDEEPDKRSDAVKVLGRLSTTLPARELLSTASGLRPADIDLAVKEIQTCAPGSFYLSIIEDLETLKECTSEFLLKGLLSAAFPLIGDRVLDLLADEEDPWTLQFLLGAMSGDRLEEALPLILSMLDHQEQSVRYAAISALSGEAIPGKKGPLLSRVKLTEGDERLRLLDALADCHEEDVFSVMFSTYMDGEEKAREAIISLLRANPSVTLIQSTVKRLAIEGGARSEILQNLLAASLVTREQSDEFITIIQDRNPKIRLAAYGILQKVADTGAYTLLVQACRSESDPALYLELFTSLIREMMGGKSECRQLMEPYLKDLGAEAVIPLVQVLAGVDSGDFLYMAVSQMIENLGEDALDVLDTLREDEDRRISSIAGDLADNIRRSMLVGS